MSTNINDLKEILERELGSVFSPGLFNALSGYVDNSSSNMTAEAIRDALNTLTGNDRLPNSSVKDSASTSDLSTAIINLIDGAPSDANTLNKLKILIDNIQPSQLTYENVNNALKLEILRDFNSALLFDYKDNVYRLHTVTTNTVITANLLNTKETASVILALKGNGTATVTFPADWAPIGNLFDNAQYLINYIIVFKQGDHFSYNVYDTKLDTPAPPQDQSLTFLAVTGITKSVNNYSSNAGISSWNAVGVFNEYFADSVEADVVFTFPVASITTGLMLGLSSSNTNHKYSEAPNYYGVYIQDGAPTMFSLPTFEQEVNVAQNSKIKISRTAANNVKLEYAANGVDYVTRQDFGTLTGSLYVHINLQATGVTLSGLIGHNLTV